MLKPLTKSITSAALLISATTLISRIIGLFRDRIFAHYFGVGPVMDAYYAAFKIPDLIYNLLIVGALSAGFIPTFTKLFFESDDKSKAWRLANNIINITSLALSFLSIIGIIFTPSFSHLIAPGFDDETRKMVIIFTRIMFGSTFILGISMVLGGILQSLRSFFFYSLAPIFYNVGIIIGAVALVPLFGISGLAWGVVLGAFLHFTIQAYSSRVNGFKWQWLIDLKDRDTWIVGKLMIPRTIGLALSQINLVIITILASLLPSGSISVFNFANNLQGVPVGIIGIPFALAAFPLLSTAAALNNKEEFIKNLSSTARQIIFLIIPLSIIFLLLRAQIVRVVLGSGEFDWNATINTSDTLAVFALSLFAQSLIPLLARAFYALSNTKTPFIIGVISELIGIIASLLLMKPLGVTGLALAFSISATLNLVLLAIALKNNLGKLDDDNIITSLIKYSCAAIPMALSIQYVLKPVLNKIFDLKYFYGVLGQGFFASLIGLAIYFIICYLLKVPEFIYFQEAFKRKLLGTKEVPATESMETNS